MVAEVIFPTAGRRTGRQATTMPSIGSRMLKYSRMAPP